MKKPILKSNIVYGSIYIIFSKLQNYRNEKQISGGKGLEKDREGIKGSFLVMEQFCILIVMVVTRIYTRDKTT